MNYYKDGFLMRRWGQFCALCVNCGKRIREGEKYSRSYDRGVWSYQHVGQCPTKEELPMPAEHYYLIIDEEGVSEIVQTESPEKAVNQTVSWGDDMAARLYTDRCVWRMFKGRADHHYLAYQFRQSGPLTGRMCHIVDLGPITAYDKPGLPPSRMTGGPGELFDCSHCSIAERLEDTEDLLSIADRADEPVVPVDEPTTPLPCHTHHAHCPPLEGYEALIEHHAEHHRGFGVDPPLSADYIHPLET